MFDITNNLVLPFMLYQILSPSGSSASIKATKNPTESLSWTWTLWFGFFTIGGCFESSGKAITWTDTFEVDDLFGNP